MTREKLEPPIRTDLTLAENSSLPGTRRPLAMVLSIMAILLLEVAALRYSAWAISDVFPVIIQKRKVLTDPDQRFDTVVMGDSRFFNLDPAVLKEALGGEGSVYNFSWPNFGPEAYYYYLDAYLQEKSAPKVIVTSFPPDMVSTPGDYLHIEDSELLRSRAFETLPAIPHLTTIVKLRNWPYLWLYTKSLLTPPSATYRKSLKALLVSLISGDGVPERPEEQKRYLREFGQTESFTLTVDGVVPDNAIDTFAQWAFGLEAYADPHSLESYKSFIELAHDAGSVVVILNTPVPGMLDTQYRENGVKSKLDEWIAILKSHENVIVVDPILPVFPNRFLSDLGHVNAAGDKAFEEELPQRLAPYLPAIRQKMFQIELEQMSPPTQ